MLNNTKETTLVKITHQHVDGYCICTCGPTQWVHRYTRTEVIVLEDYILSRRRKICQDFGWEWSVCFRLHHHKHPLGSRDSN